MHLLITGGAGFIGSNLIRWLEPRGWSVAVLDDLSNADASVLHDTKARLVRACVTDVAALENALVGVDAVVHLAALTSVRQAAAAPDDCHRRNVTATVRLLDAARSRDIHLVFASSAAVYGNAATPISESAVTAPVGPYGASKLAMENEIRRQARESNLRVLVLRLFNVIGPYQDVKYCDAVVPRFAAAALSGRPMRVFGDGHQTRDFVPVTTVCAVIEQALRNATTSANPINVASGRATSVLELAHDIATLCGVELDVDYRPAPSGEVRDSWADVTSLRQTFPTLPAIDHRDELQRAVRWHYLKQAMSSASSR
jgi:UDP-glucose 4-epimerase